MGETNETQIPRCLTCDYALLGLASNRCPECGTEFDPQDERTFRVGCEIGVVGRILLSQPGAFSLTVAFIATLTLLVAESVPDGYPLFEAYGAVLWFLILPIWFFRVSLYAICRRYFGMRGAQLTNPKLRNWIFFPAAFIVMVILLTARAPLWVTFSISKSYVEREARKQVAHPKRISGPVWFGLYRAKDVQPLPGGMQFRVSGTQGGFAYLPELKRQDLVPPGRTHFSGDWYLVDFRADYGD